LCLDLTLYHAGRKFDYFLEADKHTNECPLLKLHGSINWGLSESEQIVPFYVHEAKFDNLHDNKPVYYGLGSNLNLKKHEGKPLSGPPVIVPPTWNKNSYHGQLSNVWSKAADEFAGAENIFIIGYSLPETDSFFRYLYALGSESPKRIRNFVVINNDDSGETEKRFRDLIGRGIENRFKYIPAKFADGLKIIKNILLNP